VPSRSLKLLERESLLPVEIFSLLISSLLRLLLVNENKHLILFWLFMNTKYWIFFKKELTAFSWELPRAEKPTDIGVWLLVKRDLTQLLTLDQKEESSKELLVSLDQDDIFELRKGYESFVVFDLKNSRIAKDSFRVFKLQIYLNFRIILVSFLLSKIDLMHLFSFIYLIWCCQPEITCCDTTLSCY